MSRLLVIAALLIGFAPVGCSQPTQPLQSLAPPAKQGVLRATPRLAEVSAESPERPPHLSISIEVKPKVVENVVITVDIYFRNHEASPVTLEDFLLLSFRAVHSHYPREFFDDRTLSLAPGQTIRERIELPGDLFSEDTYQVSASLLGYGYESPPAVIRVIRPQ